MSHFRRDIEGLRAVAILLVIAYHGGVPLLTGGYVGVDVFFVLSGYLITTLLSRELETSGRINLTNFYARRARRLLPAMAVVVFMTMALGALLYAPVEHDGLGNTAIATAAYASNIYFARAATDYLAAPSQTNPLLHTWSLSVEEQFYLFWPLMVMLSSTFARARPSRQRVKGWTVAVAVLSFALSLLWTRTDQPLAFFLPFSRAWEFAAGGLAALSLSTAGAAPQDEGQFSTARGAIVRTLGWIGLGGILAAGVTFGKTTPFPGTSVLLPVASTIAVLMSGALFPDQGVARLLGISIFQFTGRISYSWYLWHWPLLVFAATLLGPLGPSERVVTLGLSLAVACASYRWVEQPLRTNGMLAARPLRSLAMAAVLALTTVALGFGWKAAASNWENLPSQEQFSRMRNDFPEIYRKGCDLYFHSAEVKECEFGSPTAARTAVLLGDSHAGHWFPAMERLFGNGDWRLVVITKSACPVVDATYFFTDIGRMYVECSEWVGASLERIRAMKPDLVVVSYFSGYQFQQNEWAEGLDRAVDGLSKSGSAVVLLRDVPLLPFDGPTCLARARWRPGFLPGFAACSARPLSADEDETFRLQREAAARHDNVATADMSEEICPNERCELMQAGIVTYRDAGHLTTKFSLELAGRLAKQLDKGLLRMKSKPSFVMPDVAVQAALRATS